MLKQSTCRGEAAGDVLAHRRLLPGNTWRQKAAPGRICIQSVALRPVSIFQWDLIFHVSFSLEPRAVTPSLSPGQLQDAAPCPQPAGWEAVVTEARWAADASGSF